MMYICDVKTTMIRRVLQKAVMHYCSLRIRIRFLAESLIIRVNLVLSSYLLSTGRNKIEVRIYRGQTLSSYPKRTHRGIGDAAAGDQRSVWPY